MTRFADKLRLLATATVFAAWTVWAVLFVTALLAILAGHYVRTGSVASGIGGLVVIAAFAIPLGTTFATFAGIVAAVVCLPVSIPALCYAERRGITGAAYFVGSGGLAGLVTAIMLMAFAVIGMRLGLPKVPAGWAAALLVLMPIGGAVAGAWYYKLTPRLVPISS